MHVCAYGLLLVVVASVAVSSELGDNANGELESLIREISALSRSHKPLLKRRLSGDVRNDVKSILLKHGYGYGSSAGVGAGAGASMLDDANESKATPWRNQVRFG